MAKEYKTKELKNGQKRYVFDVNLGYDLNGKRIRKTITSKSVTEGRKKISELRLNYRKLSDRTLTFKDAYDLYISELERGVKINQVSLATLETKQFYRKRYEYFETYQLDKIDDIIVEQWQSTLVQYKPKTRNCYETGLSIFFNWCIKKRLKTENPFKYLNKTKYEKKKIEVLTEKEFNEFISFVDDDKFRLLLVTLFFTGMRFSEAMGLKGKDIINNEIHLDKPRITRKLVESNKFKTEESKRIIPKPSWLIFPKCDGYIFNEKKTKSAYACLLKKYIKKAKFRNFTFHDLRHSYVSMCIDKGIDIYLISQIVGHKDIKMTINTYGHLYKEKRNSVTDLFENSNVYNCFGSKME